MHEYSAELCYGVQDLIRDATVQRRLSHELSASVSGVLSVQFEVDELITCHVNMHIDDRGALEQDTVDNAESLSDQMQLDGWHTKYYSNSHPKRNESRRL